MSLRIGIGTNLRIQGVKFSWIRYWAQRYLTDLAVTTTSDTTQTITATIVGTGADGISWEYSTDGINYSIKGTSVLGSYNATGLTAGTLYYWRARLYKGTHYGAYSNVDSDYTWNLTDADGNIYTVVDIGGQKWLGENLKTTKYNDGTAITQVVGNAAWAALITEAYEWPNGNIGNKVPYGALYNGYAIDTEKLAPLLQLIPCNGDLYRLRAFLGGIGVAGGHLKEVGEVHWNGNVAADNTSGFTAVGAGYRSKITGAYGSGGQLNFLWSTTLNAGQLYSMFLYAAGGGSTSIDPTDKKTGASIRCLLDISFWGDGVLFYGDSITGGTGASDNAHRWTSLLSAAKFVTETNNQIAGGMMQNTTPPGPPLAAGFRDSVAAVPARVASERKSICIAFGTNDVGFNCPAWTVAVFKQQYRESLQILNGKGWSRHNILLISPYYFNVVTSAPSYAFWGVTTPATVQRLEDHVQAVKELSIEFHTKYVDAYTYMKNNGGDTLLGVDGLHPNNAGYAAIAAIVGATII